MMERKQIRLRNYDYSKAGGYFITLCTVNREDLLRKISNQGIELNEAGEIAGQWWLRLENRFPNIALDYHVIPPVLKRARAIRPTRLRMAVFYNVMENGGLHSK